MMRRYNDVNNDVTVVGRKPLHTRRALSSNASCHLWTQCDQIELFMELLGIKFVLQSSLIFGHITELLGPFKNVTL